jgi:trk system potassium uptake protein TrkH
VVEGLTPRIRDTAIRLIYLYLALNALLFILLMATGLNAFDAFNHAISTVATGGFTNRNDSCASFPPLAQWVIIIGMMISATNFTLHLELVRGNWRAYWRNTEFRTFACITVLVTTIVAVLLYVEATNAVSETGEWNFRDAAFAVASIFSTTGFGTVDFDKWPDACRYLLAMLMLCGGMVGSTAGGFKVIRFVILCKAIRQEVHHEISPREVLTLKVDKRPLSQEIVRGVLGYLAIYVLIILIGGFAVTVFDPHLSLISAFSASISCFNSIGPGLDEVGPAGNFSAISPSSKILLSVFMLLGRLEIYPILMLFSSRFWFPK